MAESSAQTKLTLRRRLRTARRARAAAATPQARSRAGESLAEHLGAFLAEHNAGTPWVAAFESLPTEPPTGPMIAGLRAAGHRVIVPVLLADADLAWRDAETGEELGVAAVANARLIVLPALAVDVAGHRLGQGGGSYDRALLRSAPGAVRLAVVWDEEVLDAVPVDAHDQPVDAVLTPGGGLRWLRG